jgi:hypothetical protein
MKQEYNSRQRKIYKDYNSYTTDSLFEIVKNHNKYIPEVIDIINDILVERKAILAPVEPELVENKVIKEDGVVVSEREEPLNEEIHINDNEIKVFVEKLKEKSDSELSYIITRYISYEQETVAAALYLSVDRGLISFDLKEQLVKQIEMNFASHRKHIKQNNWEKDNAFIRYVSGYTDDEIYDTIDNPSDIVIDVYQAILVTAKRRELISADDFARYSKAGKAAIRTEDEIRNDENRELFKDLGLSDDFATEGELEAEKEKYWKCPKCNQLVEMEFGVCWNCQAEIPDTIIHPDKEEIIKQSAGERSFNPVKTGFICIILGAIVCLLTISRGYAFDDYWHFHYGRFIYGILAVIVGIGFLIFGIFFKSKLKGPSVS